MPEYTPVASSVQKVSGVVEKEGTSGEALNAGDLIYLDATDGDKAKKAQCDGTSAQAVVAGMVLNSAPAAGQPVKYAVLGELAIGAAIFGGVAKVLVLGTTAGKCMDVADLLATHRLVLIGWSTGTNKLKLAISNTGLQVP
ncbi:MAG: hypothetical protein KJ057_09845 [Phycisphaerae bacterium]|nr:MAG: hypothetical protein EDS66_15935 [Planctomycetota bacterium]MBE7458206.1 hypothetical protein [Planctomycetia bacterium]MCL4718760.1 hypothetical protein [Phycisphaerae bacterium]